jgi:hypothetical protein
MKKKQIELQILFLEKWIKEVEKFELKNKCKVTYGLDLLLIKKL